MRMMMEIKMNKKKILERIQRVYGKTIELERELKELQCAISEGEMGGVERAEDKRKKLERIGEQVSSGKMTTNQAREMIGLPRMDDEQSDKYFVPVGQKARLEYEIKVGELDIERINRMISKIRERHPEADIRIRMP